MMTGGAETVSYTIRSAGRASRSDWAGLRNTGDTAATTMKAATADAAPGSRRREQMAPVMTLIATQLFGAAVFWFLLPTLR